MKKKMLATVTIGTLIGLYNNKRNTNYRVLLTEDDKQSINIEADSIYNQENSGFFEARGNAKFEQGSLLISSELITGQINSDRIESITAIGTIDNPSELIQKQKNPKRHIKGEAIKIIYNATKAMIFLIDNAYLVQSSDCFSGDSITYDMNDDTVIMNSYEEE